MGEIPLYPFSRNRPPDCARLRCNHGQAAKLFALEEAGLSETCGQCEFSNGRWPVHCADCKIPQTGSGSHPDEYL